ncbi:uncharacterized protein LOC115677708 isoform X1 [Syzygium oleosum]|uniref:uncharacterized protein LOC115677708 isoform X1 n=1 Tax=Syzygium oleosum TaxID=219896 RepID=UPI0011D259D0|nr:uncharacterized protein LOC115677708 isoform X1 [Syzygium oleosum]
MPPKIQPIDIDPRVLHHHREPARADAGKPVLKSRLRRLFDRQFPGVLRISSSEKAAGGEAPPPPPLPQYGKDGGGGGGGGGGGAAEFEPSSVCLAKMVQNFIEESNEKQSVAKCGRNRCNCFNGNNNDSSDDEFDIFDGFAESGANGSSADASDALKGLIPCTSVSERNLLADTAKIVEKNKNLKRKDDLRKIVVENLSSLGYDSSICKSKWDKTSAFPAGEYEYIDVIVEGERLLIDTDFRSEFEIARSTGTYKAILQSLPYIFVGKAERLGQIVAIVSEAARQSLRKKGMHVAPWRKAEYMRARWLSPYTRASKADAADDPAAADPDPEKAAGGEKESAIEGECGEFELIFGVDESVPPPPPPSSPEEEPEPSAGGAGAGEWRPPAVRPKSAEMGGGAKVVTGLASLLKEKP